jgi:hypothetical protein
MVLMAGMGMGMVLGWVFARDWTSRKAKPQQTVPERQPSRLLTQLQGCLEVERN